MFNIAEMYSTLVTLVKALGDVDLIIIDTSAAYFMGKDEISNTEMAAHARVLSMLTKLPGGPCVLVLCHRIKHAPDHPSQCLPRGGGAFLAAMDGNLTAGRTDETVELSHHGKFRGAGFEPMAFRIEKILTTKLLDSKGRMISTVHVVPISDDEEAEQRRAARDDEDALLNVMLSKSGGSYADLASACGWVMADGTPYKMKTKRILEKLARTKPSLVVSRRDGWS